MEQPQLYAAAVSVSINLFWVVSQKIKASLV